MDQAEIPTLLSRLSSDEDAARKMAVFKLQSSINDPSFADVFISSGGLVTLRRLIMESTGNTLAYALQSLTRLLEVDMGWDVFEGPSAGDLVERLVELVVTNPLVNILRGTMSILVALVSHSQSAAGSGLGSGPRPPGSFGLRALKPAVAVFPHFFELVIQQLQSADHALCANALMLINALIRDAISSSDGSAAGPTKSGGGVTLPGEDWTKFIKRLQDLGLIKAVYIVMQSSSLQDLAHPMLEFQSLTKVLLRRWREVRVDLERPEHRRGLKGLHLASAPDRTADRTAAAVTATTTTSTTVGAGSGAGAGGADKTEGVRKANKRHNPEKWRRLGFETESPAQEFDVAGFLGMMDLTDYVKKNEDEFQKVLLEQSARPLHARCPIARASLAVTMILYDHFEVEKSDLDDHKAYQGLDAARNHDAMFRPLLLQWSRLHTAGLHAFFRIWRATDADQSDLEKVVDLARILIGRVVGLATRTKDVVEVEEELQEYDIGRLRELQMEMLELGFEHQWGQHLSQVREELKQEALQFVKEQRIRCLLQGSWFPKPVPVTAYRDAHDNSNNNNNNNNNSSNDDYGDDDGGAAPQRLPPPRTPKPWRFARLSHNRRFLHHADFEKRPGHDPGLDELAEKIDLSTISSVVSNVSAPSSNNESEGRSAGFGAARPPHNAKGGGDGSTKITVFSYVGSNGTGADADAEHLQQPKEKAILTLFPTTHSLASEWLDGLLMLLNQTPITAETGKLVKLVREYGLKIRLLNVRLETAYTGPAVGAGVVPSRKGLDEDYYYEI